MNFMKAQALATWLAILSSIVVAKPRIIGGTDANKGRFEYGQVSLQLGGLHVCGGVLVSSNLVLTAAHCRRNFDTVVVNAFNLSDSSEAREQYKPRRHFIHPNYNRDVDTHDAMIVEVDGIIDDINPIPLNKNATIPSANETVLVVGWGMTLFADDSSYAAVLQVAALYSIDPDACKSMANENGQSLGDWILEDHLCAWEERKDACSGDSGSPLILPGESQNGHGDVLVGIVSWGVDCAGPLPGVYGRISYMYSWLEQVICTLSSAPPDNMECEAYDLGTEITPNVTDCKGCDSVKRQGDDEGDAFRESESNGIPTGDGITWLSVCAVNIILLWI